jgi:hypothetical protein
MKHVTSLQQRPASDGPTKGGLKLAPPTPARRQSAERAPIHERGDARGVDPVASLEKLLDNVGGVDQADERVDLEGTCAPDHELERGVF